MKLLKPAYFETLLLHVCMWLCLNLTSSLQYRGQQNNLQIAKQWKLITYNFAEHAPVNDVNFYNPMNVLVTGIAIGYDRIFLAMPQLFSGVPSTIGFVPKAEFGDSPVVQAYPDWSYSTTGQSNISCSDLKLISAYRMRIDSCNRLWILDSGISRSIEDFQVTCPPRILVVDLKNDQVVRRIDFPKEVLRGETLFTNLVVDETTSTSGTCDDVFVYISDTVEPAIVVYDSTRDVTWRVTHPAMYPDPDFAESKILDHKFILMDGIVGMTFDEQLGVVYFQPLATDRIFSVAKDALRAGPLAQNEVLKVKLVGRKASQGIGLAVSPIDSSLIFSPMSETAVAAWNPKTNNQLVLAADREKLQFVADMSIPFSESGVVYVISSKFHRFFLKNLNSNEVNNRIIRIKLPARQSPTPVVSNFLPSIASPAKYSVTPLRSNYNYYHTNGVSSENAESADYSTHAAFGTKTFPYNFDNAGIINYAIHSPFTALNQGETFAPATSKPTTPKLSFLDSLPFDITPTPRSTFGLHTNIISADNSAYYYQHRQ